MFIVPYRCRMVGLALAATLAACAQTDPREENDPETLIYGSLAPFGSSTEFEAYIGKLRSARKAEQDAQKEYGGGADAVASQAAPEADNESITNNQEAGVDEGGIVKAYRGFLVVLRRGRLFSVRLEDAGKSELTPVSYADAFAPGSQLGTWYDEMLIYKSRVIVIGYSYRVGATEVGVFSINEKGMIAHVLVALDRDHLDRAS